MGEFELPQLLTDGASKGAGNVTEQFAFQQGFWQRTARHLDKRLIAAAAAPMDARATRDLPVPLSP